MLRFDLVEKNMEFHLAWLCDFQNIAYPVETVSGICLFLPHSISSTTWGEASKTFVHALVLNNCLENHLHLLHGYFGRC